MSSHMSGSAPPPVIYAPRSDPSELKNLTARYHIPNIDITIFDYLGSDLRLTDGGVFFSLDPLPRHPWRLVPRHSHLPWLTLKTSIGSSGSGSS